MIKTGLFAAAGLLALGLAAPAAPAQESTEENRGSNCVWLRNINGYTVLDNQHLVLNGGANRHYLVTTRTRCAGLRFGVQIATSFDATERLCQPMLEYVIPEDGWRCAIDTIEEVESIEQARERAEARAINARIERGEGAMEDPNRD